MTVDLDVVDRTKLPLSAVAKHLVMPSGIVSTDWPGLYNRTIRRKLGITYDGWQNGCGRILLSKRANGRLACTIGGFAASFARQTGKTYFMTGSLFGLSIEKPGMLSLWSAHHSKTHGETFLYMQAFCQRPQVQPFIENVFTGSGDEEVRFVNGSRILFGARERGFGRGIPNVDAEVFDEAQILSAKALENMLASMNRSMFGLHVYLGTPPKPSDPCEAFEEMRSEALAFKRAAEVDAVFDSAWVECGADDDADLDDWEQVAKANPSYPVHTSPESILRLRKRLGPDGFRREGLGIWPSGLRTVFDLVGWVGLEDRAAEPPRRVALVVHVAEYRKSATIAVAGELPDGSTLVLVMSGEGMGWVADKVVELVAERDIAEVALAPGEARALEGDLTSAGVEFKKLSGADIASSCTAFQSAVAESAVAVGRQEKPRLRHTGQMELDGAVAKGKTKRVGAAETWEDGTDSALVAAAAAFHRWKLQEAPLPAIY
jgi:hypothetical protein